MFAERAAFHRLVYVRLGPLESCRWHSAQGQAGRSFTAEVRTDSDQWLLPVRTNSIFSHSVRALGLVWLSIIYSPSPLDYYWKTTTTSMGDVDLTVNSVG